MVVIGTAKIEEFKAKHPKSASPLNRWLAVTIAAEWKTPADIRDTFRSVDFVDGKVVFDIGGNNFRLIALVVFEKETVIVSAVLTHAEYDKGKWK